MWFGGAGHLRLIEPTVGFGDRGKWHEPFGHTLLDPLNGALHDVSPAIGLARRGSA